MITNTPVFYMQEAIKQAKKAFEEDEVPVGCVIIHKGKVIARSYNQIERLKDPTAHAEMIAITQATNFLKNKWLNDCSAYVTIEPCSMCAGAFVLARIKTVYFGAEDPKTGACGSIIDITNLNRTNHKFEIKKGTLKEECSSLLSEFFNKKRNQPKKKFFKYSLN